MEFSPDGRFLATGDRNGKISILRMEQPRGRTPQLLENWIPHFQFQSHDPEFDFLKSIEIESKINQIKFLPQNGTHNLLLSTNGEHEYLHVACKFQLLIIVVIQTKQSSYGSLASQKRLSSVMRLKTIKQVEKLPFQNAKKIRLNL